MQKYASITENNIPKPEGGVRVYLLIGIDGKVRMRVKNPVANNPQFYEVRMERGDILYLDEIPPELAVDHNINGLVKAVVTEDDALTLVLVPGEVRTIPIRALVDFHSLNITAGW